MADETLPFSTLPRTEKRCRWCRKQKPLSEFHYRRELLRYRTECKECYRARRTATRDHEDNRRRVKEWQKANPEKKRAQCRLYYSRVRADLRRSIAMTLRAKRADCKRRGIEVAITADDVVALYQTQDGCCALTGRELAWGGEGMQRDTLSIDRLDQSQGYVPGNIRLVTYQANFARNQYSDADLIAFCEAVLAWHSATSAR